MASISSAGLGSGLDINGIITKLMAVEAQPLTALATKEASYQAKLSAFGSLKGALSTLQTVAQTLKNTSTFENMSASVSSAAAFTASASSTAVAGTYDIDVTTLAKNHIVRSDATYDLADTFKGGTLSFQIGSNGGTGGTTTTVTIPDGSTLAGVSDAINNANIGVTASIVNDGTTNRLIFSSSTTGSAGNIRITTATDPLASGGTPVSPGVTQSLSDFNYTGADTATMVEQRPPDNAVFDVNGLTVIRSSNAVTDAISGVTLNLVSEGSSGKLTVSKNNGSVTSAVSAFVKAYNDAIGQIKTMTAYDAANKKASVLTGDSTTRSIQSQLSSMIGASVSGITGGISRLSDIGIRVQTDGTLTLDSSKLSTALADPDTDVAALFTQTTSGNQGIAVRINSLLEGIVGSSGIIASRTDGINASIKDLQNRADSMNLRLTAIEARYRAQFTALDTLISSMNQTSSYLTQQLASLPGASSK